MNNDNATYLWQRADWPFWQFDTHALASLITEVHQAQTKMAHRIEKLTSTQRKQVMLQLLTDDVLNTSEIEGERLDAKCVQATIAQHLDMQAESQVSANQQCEGIVRVVMDATLQFAEPLTQKRLFSWHDALFPTSYSVISTTHTGNTESWRDEATDPMQVVSGAIDHQIVHYEAPPARRLNEEMESFLRWFNVPVSASKKDPYIKAGIAHLWFLTIHPFGDGNGRIARAINDIALARANGISQRFYSFSAQIQRVHDDYYRMLETTQKGSMDVTEWLSWFLGCLVKSINKAEVELPALR